MTLSIESGGDVVEIEEDDEVVILLEETESGILLSVRGIIEDAGDAISVIKPVDFVSFSNESYDSQVRDSLESLILSDTTGSHLMTKGSVSQEAINRLESRADQHTSDEYEH
ncbi:MAG: hypothetical protein J07HQX50_01888 [Haloquadratum sp. J07HQX50]|jgi:hypothetical protein|nr:MAG: hypothetical protein J07HQX50_01888 [Haloquadratum sp. J07HQX50]